MRTALVNILLFSCLATTGQAGKLDLKLALINADTTYPYYLDIWIKKKDSLITRIATTGSGTLHLGNFLEGVYNLELDDHRARKMSIDLVSIIADSITSLSITYPGACKYIYPKDYKPVCPKNHNDSIVNILYGLPNAKARKKAKEGAI